MNQGASPVLAQMLNRVGDDAGYRRWSAQVERAGFCVRPVRLAGSVARVDAATGEVDAIYSTAGEPNGTLLVACKDRRESVCPPCAARYRADAWHVFASGLAGRDGHHEEGGHSSPVGVPGAGVVPATVGNHPAVLATFTAPSFGRVHAFRGGGVCRPWPRRRGRRDAALCPHGKPRGCGLRHGPDDGLIGAPLCDECADLAGMVLWNAHAGELWRRTVIYVYRALAALCPAIGGRAVTVRGVRALLRVSYVKVAEFQRRGVVHLHVIARLDGVDGDDPERIVAPPAWAGVDLLAAAIAQAGARVRVPLPDIDGVARVARWGEQLDVRPINQSGSGSGSGSGARGPVARLAGYLAKYATKTLGDAMSGLPASRGRGERLVPGESDAVPGHVRALVETVRALARHPACRGLRLARHVHTLGFAGHVTSKSRRYSVTFAVLRAARRAWRIATGAADRDGPDPWAAHDEHDGDGDGGGSWVVAGHWRMVGLGYATFGDAALAGSLGRQHRAARAAARLGLIE